MAEPNNETHIGGVSSRVGDCYIWAEIYYLDSCSDYREYLPPRIHEVAGASDQLVMLDEVMPSPFSVVLRNLAEKAACILRAINAVLRIHTRNRDV